MTFTQEFLEVVISNAYLSHNEFIRNEGRLLRLSPDKIMQRETAFILNLDDSSTVASFILRHFIQEGPRLRLIKAPAAAASESRTTQHEEKIQEGDAVDTSRVQETPVESIFLKKVPGGGLSNSIIVFTQDDVLNILVKPRINYSNPANQKLVKKGAFKVIKPYGLMIQLGLSSTHVLALLKSFPLVTWARTSEDARIEPAPAGDETVAPSHNRQLSRGQKLRFLEDPHHPLMADLKNFVRIDYPTLKAAPDDKGTILYQEYYGIPLDELIIMDFSKKSQTTQKIFTTEFRCSMIFSFLNSLLQILERGEWPSDIKFGNICAMLLPDGSLKCTVIDYLHRYTSTYSLFQSSMVGTRWDRRNNMALLKHVRARHHAFFDGPNLKYWNAMRTEFIFEVWCVIYLMSKWPEALDIKSAVWNKELIRDPKQLGNNQVTRLVLHEGKIKASLYNIGANQGECDGEGQLRDAFIQFLAIAVYQKSNTRFVTMLNSLIYRNYLLTGIASQATSRGLPWPVGFTKEWIEHFGSLVDNFVRPPGASAAAAPPPSSSGLV